MLWYFAKVLVEGWAYAKLKILMLVGEELGLVHIERACYVSLEDLASITNELWEFKEQKLQQSKAWQRCSVEGAFEASLFRERYP